MAHSKAVEVVYKTSAGVTVVGVTDFALRGQTWSLIFAHFVWVANL